MRRTVIVAIVLALAGCQSVRSGLGQYKRAADKGIELRTGGQTPDTAADASGATPASSKRDKGGDPTRSLPGGLGGDTAHGAYSEPPPPR